MANLASQVIVIGGGPAGMMAAGMAAVRGKNVILFEKNKSLGKKLLITGKGRCNISNETKDVHEFINNVPVNGNFLYSAYSKFAPKQLIKFFNILDLDLKVERGGRIFPSSDKSVDVLKAMELYLKRNKVRVLNGDVDQVVIEKGAVKGIYLSDDEWYEASSIVIATGGLSYPDTGSTGDGYWFAKVAGHNIIETKASLVPLESNDTCCKDMQGLTLKNAQMKVLDKDNQVIYEDFGELLFTHFGLSGPTILSASSHMRDFEKNKYTISIDLKPALDEEKLDKRLLSDFSKFAKSNFSNSLGDLFPVKMIPVILKRCSIPANKKCSEITKEQRFELLNIIKNFTIEISNPRPIEEAIVTSGGVDVTQINPSTMESKLVKGLYFAGEVIDVDAYTGGFNLQIAFSTGYVAGDNVK